MSQKKSIKEEVVILPRGEMLKARYESAREFASLTPHQQENIIARQKKASKRSMKLYA